MIYATAQSHAWMITMVVMVSGLASS